MRYHPNRKFDEFLESSSPTLGEIGAYQVYLTPRAVERRVPYLSRRELSRRRALGLRPSYEMIAGCVMYDEDEIDGFLFGPANDNSVGPQGGE
jgi:hypothetical protein